MTSPLHILNTIFGFPAFRGLQAEVISHVVAGGDALVLMPTGAGKSLCYQVPALCRDGLAVVVSPLIALMQNQVEALTQLGVRAAALNSARSFDEANVIERKMRAGELDLVYVAPERLVTPGFLALLDTCQIALFAIDEAHCVSQWGHDFRPEYLQLALLHERFPSVPRIALTATADGPTRRDIAERLNLGDGRLFVAGFDRPNIRYRITAKKNTKEQLLRFLDAEHGGADGDSGIIYCLSRAKVEETAAWLVEKGYTALAYHAGLDQSLRASNQQRFLREDGVVMVATIAFGMDRQTRCPVRRPSRSAQKPGILLPGNRPRRARWPARQCLDGLWPGGCRQTESIHRQQSSLRNPKADRAGQAQRPIGPVRNHALPPSSAVGLFRRYRSAALR